MEWVDLLVPSAAVLALFAAAALIVQSVLHSRAIRRLERQLAEHGAAAEEAALERVRQLQTRAAVGEGGAAPRRGVRTLGVLAAVIVALAAAGAGAWFVLVRDDGGGGPDAPEAQAPAATTTAQARPAPPPQPVDDTAVGNPRPLADPSQFTVTVFNASGIAGAAGETIAPIVEGEGYQVVQVTDSPDGRTDLAQSVVMWSKGRRNVARNIAKALGIAKAPPVDGYTEEQIAAADAVVVIGRDVDQLASVSP